MSFSRYKRQIAGLWGTGLGRLTMTTAILIALVVAAGLACPAMMWWQSRRGRAAACWLPMREDVPSSDLEALRTRQRELSVRIAELDEEPNYYNAS
jgi:hypothetical protein